ncbi:zinc transporter ZIP11 isoform X4 [Tachysurus fulvidraco]|uniref:zinc transporter ZIP11 isoform X4 n=1 Tax=Tachysurus fulvidraco TaxID=1234273 RepID=UPI001FEE713F|nr:zinc transporter ZIP11 isoform X4 [Tachysurus fulvidraco]
MLADCSPVVQALLGTLLTWGLTAAGAALVFIFSSTQKKILDGSLGFAAGGVETDPHLALTLSSGAKPAKAKVEDPAATPTTEELSIRIGRGGSHLGKPPFINPSSAISFTALQKCLNESSSPSSVLKPLHLKNLFQGDEASTISDKIENGDVHHRRKGNYSGPLAEEKEVGARPKEVISPSASSWRRIVLLILAITIHNIPEGLAVGVGFAAAGKTPSATFESARNLAIGIGIQNFPEGLAVSLPLRGSGLSTWRAFWYGQLSGMVEPVAGLLGAVAVVVAEPLLPYALAFAAGAMVYVVVDDIIPEAQVNGNGKLASWTSILGFIVMMSLDVGLG